jgi:hypothetical protein
MWLKLALNLEIRAGGFTESAWSIKAKAESFASFPSAALLLRVRLPLTDEKFAKIREDLRRGVGG